MLVMPSGYHAGDEFAPKPDQEPDTHDRPLDESEARSWKNIPSRESEMEERIPSSHLERERERKRAGHCFFATFWLSGAS